MSCGRNFAKAMVIYLGALEYTEGNDEYIELGGACLLYWHTDWARASRRTN